MILTAASLTFVHATVTLTSHDKIDVTQLSFQRYSFIIVSPSSIWYGQIACRYHTHLCICSSVVSVISSDTIILL